MNIQIVLIITLLTLCSQSSRSNVTDFYSGLLGYNLTYQAWSGYEDVDWYIPESQASVYYSLWECSTKTFADHSVPVIFWIQGGPGMSSQFAAFQQIGPLAIEGSSKEYEVKENPWSWNYNAHLVFVDQPIGTGLSYNKGKNVANTETATKHFINFMYNFFKNTPLGLKNNPIYLAGEGYAGHFIPAFAQAMLNNGSLGLNLKGILLGGGFVDPQLQSNYYDSFLYSTGITSSRWRSTTKFMENKGVISLKNNDFSSYWNSHDFILSPKTSSSHYGGMNINNYKAYGNEGTNIYVYFINNYKNKLGIPSFVSFSESNSGIYTAFKNDFAKSYRKTLDTLLSKNLKVLIYNGQNDFQVNTAGVLNYLQNLSWKQARQWMKKDKETWKETGNNIGWVKKHNNLIFVVLRKTGHNFYQDNETSGRAALLMANNYFSNKW